jgi:hypothetical protein
MSGRFQKGHKGNKGGATRHGIKPASAGAGAPVPALRSPRTRHQAAFEWAIMRHLPVVLLTTPEIPLPRYRCVGTTRATRRQPSFSKALRLPAGRPPAGRAAHGIPGRPSGAASILTLRGGIHPTRLDPRSTSPPGAAASRHASSRPDGRSRDCSASNRPSPRYCHRTETRQLDEQPP